MDIASRSTRPHLVAIVVLAALSGCASAPKQAATPPPATRHGTVSESTIESTAAESYPIELGVSYEQPVILGDYPLPEYPAAQLALRLPAITLDVRVVVTADGRVERVDPLSALDARMRPFFDATQSALMRWEYAPLRRIENGRGQEMPFHQKYRFTFAQVDGRPDVGMQR
jgi:outer membrane biosynthesis protein TonB